MRNDHRKDAPHFTIVCMFERFSPLIPHEGDGFKMKPLSIGCKSQWKIDCLVASCSPDLQFENPEMYSQYCKGRLSN